MTRIKQSVARPDMFACLFSGEILGISYIKQAIENKAAFLQIALIMAGSICTYGMDSFEISGRVYFRNFNRDNKVIMSTASSFKVTVEGRTWAIRLEPDDKSVVDYSAITYDGTNIYHYNYLETGINISRQLGQRVADNIASGRVIRGPIPRLHFANEAGPIWLAFASSFYFDNLKGEYAENPAVFNTHSGSDPEPYMSLNQKARWKREHAFPFLISGIVYYDDGKFRMPGSMAPDKTVKFPLAYQKGFTNTIYSTSHFTNMNGIYFPSEAMQRTYFIKKDGKDARELRLMNEYRIVPTNALRISFMSTDSRISPPLLPGLTMIFDFRFSSNLAPIYLVAYKCSNQFLTDSQVLNLDEYKIALANARHVFGTRDNESKYPLIIFLTISLVLAFFLARRIVMLKRKEQRQSERNI